jgi:ABC-type transport system involved in multi-copper enzyme maturation permease subunit
MSVIHSEWVKFRSLRSLLATAATVVVMMAGLGALFAFAGARKHVTEGTAGFDPTAASLSGLLLAQIAVAVLGVLTVTTEFASGLIRPSLAAVPARARLLAAKATMLVAVALVAGWVGSLVAYLLGRPIVAAQGLTAASLADAARPVVGAGLYLGATALLGLALGAMIRSTAGALTVVIVVLLAVPIFSPVLPEAVARWVSKWWPSLAGLRVATVVPDPSQLEPWAGFGVLTAFVAVVLAGSFLVFRRRDV